MPALALEALPYIIENAPAFLNTASQAINTANTVGQVINGTRKAISDFARNLNNSN